jgi:hypothetical protein
MQALRTRHIMKFWELTSAFRSETANLELVLQDPKWIIYKSYYDNLKSLVQQQDRAILDSEIPFDLAYEVSAKSNLKFWLYYKKTPHFLTSWKQGTDEPFEEISASDILIRFGGSVIEETLERSVSEVTPRKLDGKVEVINAFNLTQIGMLAILRTENNLQLIDKELSSSDGQRQWLVIKKPFMLVDPFSAHMKMKSQEEQGIFQYIIKPVVGQDKPTPGDILTLKV